MLVSLAGETLHLRPERAVWWPRRSTVIVADLHWGKGATFRAAGIPVPRGVTADDLQRLSRLLDDTSAERLLVLGDLFHARAGARSASATAELVAWRDARRELQVVLVRGNHDRSAGDPAQALGIACTDGPVVEAPFAWRHVPAPTEGAYTLAGHVHPAVTLRSTGRMKERLPAFVLGQQVGLLPAFGAFTGTAPLEPEEGDAVYVIVENEVVEVAPTAI
jgi:DNA ligase-associated metallophosphoesterase